MENFLRNTEYALTSFAVDYSCAANELNPFLEAEALLLGSGAAVYSGRLSAVHGVYGQALEAPMESQDFTELEEFFQRVDREMEFWVTDSTDPSVFDYLESHGMEVLRRENVFGCSLKSLDLPKSEYFSTTPDHGHWAMEFSRSEDSAAREPNLFASTLLYLKKTRFYSLDGAASFSYFREKLALSPLREAPNVPLLSAMLMQAKEFRCEHFACVLPEQSAAPAHLPKIYTRLCYGKRKEWSP